MNWIDIVIVSVIPIFIYFIWLIAYRLNHLIVINDGIFKQNNKIYKYILMSGLFDMSKDVYDTGKKFLNERKKKKSLKEGEKR